MLSFWGVNMQALIAELRRRGLYRAGMSMAEFRRLLERETGVCPAINARVEDAAAQWLTALRSK